MKVSTFNKFVQISINRDNPVLPKIIKYATKYFQHQYHLSSSILILDDGERLKKDYLINWAYHLAMQYHDYDSECVSLDSILEMSYLPIRIKMVSTNPILETVKITYKIISQTRSVLSLDRPSHVAKRYIIAVLGNLVVTSDLQHIYLDSSTNNFWYFLMQIVGNKIIHNVRLEFDYESFKSSQFGKKTFKASYLTQSEIKLNSAYATLGCSITDSFFDVKARYFALIKEFHPDKVFGKDEEIVKSYNLRFIELKEAFDIIKLNFEKAPIV